MPAKRDISGQRFGMLVVLSEHDKTRNGKFRWRCRCDCGQQVIVIGGDMCSGKQVSCGCLKDRKASQRQKERYKNSHHLSKTPIGMTWRNMMDRVRNPQNKHYHNYGGRGIVICAGLASSPQSLLDVVGEKPSRSLTIDRVDNNGNYSCGKCDECVSMKWPMNLRWATRTEQMRNVRYNHMLEINGETRCIAEWEDRYGLTNGIIKQRLSRGWESEELLAPKNAKYVCKRHKPSTVDFA